MRLKLTLAYAGAGFRGWVPQPGLRTVEGVLREALAVTFSSWRGLAVAGRTDAGVHALAMSAHADIAKPLTPHRLREGLNALVRPQPISILSVEPVTDAAAHARGSNNSQKLISAVPAGTYRHHPSCSLAAL